MHPALTTFWLHWPGVVFRQRADLSFEFISPNLEAVTGVPVARWLERADRLWEIVHEDDAAKLRQHLAQCAGSPQGRASAFRIRHARHGRIVYLSEFRRAIADASGQVCAYEGFWQDVTPQVRLEHRLAGAAWLEALSALTMGFVHDFNNVLTGILSLSDAYLLQISPEHPFHEGLTLIKQNAQQAGQQIQRLVQLHQGAPGGRGYQDVNTVVADTAGLLRKFTSRRIEIVITLAAGALPVFVDAGELRQTIIYLALNAVQAMPGRGRIVLETSQHGKPPALEHADGALPAGPAVCVAIMNDGAGTTPQPLDTIFEPDFAARQLCQGLGRYNARRFAEKHRGAISVEPLAGGGMAFRLWLPQADFTEAEPAPGARQGRRALLLAGPATGVAADLGPLLRREGFQVAMAAADAEELARSDEYQFDGILVLAAMAAEAALALIGAARKQSFPPKIIVQVPSGNPEETDTRFLQLADLLLSVDLPAEAVVEKLKALWA